MSIKATDKHWWLFQYIILVLVSGVFAIVGDGKEKVIEDGTHQTLVAQEGVYARLWKHQAGGFLVE